ncbi:MAG: flagellar brake domain-containing protein [Candidatus Desulforudis sp.]|nr:flagellar brake domain-containing protein [Desulforudis sp.]
MRLEIGQKLYMNRDEDSETYVTSLQDVSQGQLLVGVPYYRGRPLVLGRGDGVLVTFVSDEGIFRFPSTYLGRRMDQIPLYLLDRPREVERIQRRRMVRLPVTLEVRGAEKPLYGAPEGFEHWFTSDLSGGGACLITDRRLTPGTRLILEFSVSGPGRPRRISTLGRVQRSVRLEDDELNRYAVGVEFQELSKAGEDAIVAFIFRKMVEERRAR